MTRINSNLCDMINELTKAGVNLDVNAESAEFRNDYNNFRHLTEQRNPWDSGINDAEFFAGYKIAGHDISDTLAKDIRKQYKKLKISQICKEPEFNSETDDLQYIPLSAITNYR